MRKTNPVRYSSAVGEAWMHCEFKIKYCHTIFEYFPELKRPKWEGGKFWKSGLAEAKQHWQTLQPSVKRDAVNSFSFYTFLSIIFCILLTKSSALL